MNYKKLLVCFFMLTYAGSVQLFAQGVKVPQPVNNKLYDAMVGEWIGESDMMGIRMTDTMTIRWGLGHQFLIVELHSVGKNNPAAKYEGIGLFGQDEKGNVVTWWFDSLGPSGISTGSGTFTANKVEIKNGNSTYSEQRSFEVKEGVLYTTAKGSKMMNGIETPYTITTVYTKK